MTDVYFSFDTEDYTSNESSTSIMREANMLHSLGIRGNINLVGYLARELIRNRRYDVLDSFKNHSLSTHSLRHSYHPTICEYTDLEDYHAARAEFERQEAEGIGMIKAATGRDSLLASCPPGFSMSYVAMYTYADWGLPIFIGGANPMPDGSGFYFCNGFHTNYDIGLEEELFRENYSQDELLDRISSLKRCFFCHHPHRAIYKQHWDRVNYFEYNLHPMFEWESPERRTDEEIEMFYERFYSLAKAIKADPRFSLPALEELDEKVRSDIFGRTVTKDMLGMIKDNLERDFKWLDSPVSLSVADCFFAARHFLTTDEPYKTGRVHGFLAEPEGITTDVTLTAEDVRKAALAISPDDFIPSSIAVGDKRIGPADLLFAMLDTADGASLVTLHPRKQNCNYEEVFHHIKNMKISGMWLHSPEFRDAWLSDRLREQNWTLRPEV